jgi:hypothetical protein
VPEVEALDWMGSIKEILDEVAAMFGQNIPHKIQCLTRPIGFVRELLPLQ